MVIHEAGHALFTPAGNEWQATASRVSPKNPEAGAAYLNIVEDVRIERKMLDKYPGAKRDFSKAYTEAWDADMFGAKNVPMQALSFVDRVNLHFKVGRYGLVHVPFTADEQRIVDQIENCQTWEDVESATRALVNYQPPQDADPNGGDGDGEGESDNQSDSNQKSKGKSNKDDQQPDQQDDQGTSDDSDGDSDDESDADGDSDDESDADGDSDDESDADGESDGGDKATDSQDQGGKGTGSLPESPAPDMPTTQQAFEAAASDQTEKTDTNTHSTYTVEHDDEVMVLDYKTTNEIIGKARAKASGNGFRFSNRDFYAEFIQSKKKDTAMVSQMFNKKKAADEWRRTQTSRTGMIDTNRLIHYKTSEDIFSRSESVKEGKNHCMYMVVDWSGSMLNILRDSVDQVCMLAMFCRQNKIPFEVSFFTNEMNFNGKLRQGSFPINDVRGYCTLVNILSDRMSNQEFKDGIRNFRFMAQVVSGSYLYGARRASWKNSLYPFALSGTPLEESIVLARNGVLALRKRTQAQVCHTLFLTDGAGYPILGGHKSMNLIDTKYGFNGTITNKPGQNPTQELLCDWFRATTGSTISNFFLTGSLNIHRNAPGADSKTKTRATDEFEKWGGTSLGPSQGWDDLYLVNPAFGSGTSYSKNDALADMHQAANANKGKRIVLDRFTTMIAK